MGFADVIIVLIVLLAMAAAITYIIRAKKRGVKCIGCSAAGNCSSKGAPSSGCACAQNVDEIVRQIKEDS